jgi:hypothetical protein
MRNCGGTRGLAASLLGAAGLLSFGACQAGAPASSGADLYREFCASCHGLTGHGNGPVAASVDQAVPDLTLLAQRHGGIFPVEQVHRLVDGRSVTRAHGSVDMPVWGHEFFGFEPDDATHRRRVAELIDRLVEYLQSIQRKAP